MRQPALLAGQAQADAVTLQIGLALEPHDLANFVDLLRQQTPVCNQSFQFALAAAPAPLGPGFVRARARPHRNVQFSDAAEALEAGQR